MVILMVNLMLNFIGYKIIILILTTIKYNDGYGIETRYLQPEQIHLSLGADESEMIVTWITFDLPKSSTVWYGETKLDKEAQGSNHKFVDGGSLHRQMHIHRVIINGLTPGQSYKYHVGSEDGWSPIYQFTTLKTGNKWSPRFALFSDLGNDVSVTLARLQDQSQKALFDAVVHLGDMAYDMHTNNATVGDEFMRQIEPIAAYLPYQVIAGNHEYAYNFSNYDNRFTMVSKGSEKINNFFWSYDIGPAHFIAFNTEFYYFTVFGTEQIENQYRWLEKDLIEANRPEKRAQTPWIITMGHRPLYAQTYVNNYLRLGISYRDQPSRKFGLEELFYKYGVDLELWAHEHSYERLWPVYNLTVYNGSCEQPYTNPKAPVHIITGSAGNREGQTHTDIKPNYSAYRSEDLGFTRMTVHNNTHIFIEQVSDDKNGEIVDKFYLIKDKHGPNKDADQTYSI